ncbi:MAG: flagellar hook-length control protein FliK [Bacteroidota bacterium]
MAQQLLPVTSAQNAAIGIKAPSDTSSGTEQAAPFRSALQVAMKGQSETGNAQSVHPRGKAHAKHPSKGEKGSEGDGDTGTGDVVAALLGQTVTVAPVDLSTLLAQAVSADATATLPSENVNAGVIKNAVEATVAEKGTSSTAPSSGNQATILPFSITESLAGVLEEQRAVLDGLGAQNSNVQKESGDKTTKASVPEVLSAAAKEATVKADLPLPAAPGKSDPATNAAMPIPEGFLETPVLKERAALAEGQISRAATPRAVETPAGPKPDVDPAIFSQKPAEGQKSADSATARVPSSSQPPPAAQAASLEPMAKAVLADLAIAMKAQGTKGEQAGQGMGGQLQPQAQTQTQAQVQSQAQPQAQPQPPVLAQANSQAQGQAMTKSGQNTGEAVSAKQTQEVPGEVFTGQQVEKNPVGLPGQVTKPAPPQEHGEALPGWRFQAQTQGIAASSLQPVEGGKDAPASAPTLLPEQTARSVVDQVIKGLTITLSESKQEMRVTFKPESLGEMTLQVRMDDGKLHAQIEVSQPAVKTAIEQQMTDLRQTLQDRGIDVQRIEVFASGQSSSALDGQTNRGGRFKQKSGKRHEPVSSVEDLRQARSMGYNTLEVTM